MAKSKKDLSESEIEPQPGVEDELKPESQPEVVAEPKPESPPIPETEPNVYVNVKIQKAFDRAKLYIKDATDYYQRSPRLQNASYQGKFMPAFWTVACIFSLIVNIVLLAILISFGRSFFEFKALVADGLVNGTANSLELMDKAHIVTTVPVQTTVQLQDSLPVVFDMPINQDTKVSLVRESRIPNAQIYLNNTAVTTDLTLPASTSIQANIDLNIPVSTTVPVDITVPVTIQVPVDIPVDKTDLHQSIIGLQGAIDPYKTLMVSSFNSPKDFSVCNHWWSGWLCGLFFGKQ